MDAGTGQTWVDQYMSYIERTSQVFANAARCVCPQRRRSSRPTLGSIHHLTRRNLACIHPSRQTAWTPRPSSASTTAAPPPTSAPPQSALPSATGTHTQIHPCWLLPCRPWTLPLTVRSCRSPTIAQRQRAAGGQEAGRDPERPQLPLPARHLLPVRLYMTLVAPSAANSMQVSLNYHA